MAANKILVDKEQTGVHPTYKAKIFSTTVGFRARTEVTLKTDGAMYITMPGVPSDIPIVVMIKSLGYEEDSKIAEMISTDETLQNQLAPTSRSPSESSRRGTHSSTLVTGWLPARSKITG